MDSENVRGEGVNSEDVRDVSVIVETVRSEAVRGEGVNGEDVGMRDEVKHKGLCVGGESWYHQRS